MVGVVENWQADTTEDLRKQLAVAQACREFWYREYVRASTYARDQIDAAVAHARQSIMKDHAHCDEALLAMEKEINDVLVQMFVTDGRRTGSNAVLPSSVPMDTDGPKVA